jgi:phosphoribosyl-ATP pyrophosphohydrolase
MQPQQYVGIDLHRRRSVIVRMSAEGEKLSCVRLPNDPVEVATEIAKAGEGPEVVIEATYGWYWLVDLLQQQGAKVHLAHPLGSQWEGRRPIKPSYSRIAARRGNKIARVAAARKLLTLVYYGLRDGEVRCLAKAG